MDPELGACLFHKCWWELDKYSVDGGNQAGFGIVGGHVGDVLNVWPNEVVQRVQVGEGSGGSERRAQSCCIPSETKPESICTCGPAPSPAATARVCHRPHGDHHTLQHIQVHLGVDFQADFEDVRWYDVALTWNHTRNYNHSRKLCFHQPGHVPVIRGNPDLHFEGAGNGLVVINWIGRAHGLYSGASPISFVEHSLSDMIEGSYRSWDLYTTGQLVDGLQ